MRSSTSKTMEEIAYFSILHDSQKKGSFLSLLRWSAMSSDFQRCWGRIILNHDAQFRADVLEAESFWVKLSSEERCDFTRKAKDSRYIPQSRLEARLLAIALRPKRYDPCRLQVGTDGGDVGDGPERRKRSRETTVRITIVYL